MIEDSLSISETQSVTTLGELQKGQRGLITQIGWTEQTHQGCLSAPSFSQEMTQRLMEMGFLEGALVEVLHLAPFGNDPFVVRVRGSLVALRRNEAHAVQVSVLNSDPLKLK